MYLSNIKLWNFRKYGSDTFDIDKPNLDLNFTEGLNVLIGENDSGKTAIIDAIKIVLKTHSYEYIKIETDDFYNNSDRLRIELKFKGFLDEEAKNFTEWFTWEGQGENSTPILRVFYDVRRKDYKILPSEVRVGEDTEGNRLTAEAKEFLKITYLRPLRDAESGLVPKRNSRLSQILLGDNIFKVDNHFLVNKFRNINDELKKYFNEGEGSSIKENINGIEFHISPTSFFQINVKQAKRLYNIAISFFDNIDDKYIVDAYSGTGTIGMIMAKKTKKVYAIEIVKSASEDGEKTAKENGIKNIEFINGAVEKEIIKLINNNQKIDTIIFDPPRKGLEASIIDTVAELNLKVVYISCNPSTFARDVKLFSERGYVLKKLQAVDMFPQTSHIECVGLIVKE